MPSGCGSWTPTAPDGALDRERSWAASRAGHTTGTEWPSSTSTPGPSAFSSCARVACATLLGFGSFQAHAWAPDGYRLALMRAVPVECDGPYECESLELSILDLRTSRRLIVFSMPDAGEVYGLDWRAAAQ